MTVRIGLISDTHGLLRPEALAALARSEAIIHAGDIGAPDVLDALSRIAPVTAIRGNNDIAEWARAIPETAVLSVGAVSIVVVHDRNALAPAAARAHHVVVAGHSHRPHIERCGGTLFVNPGSAGPRRFSLPVTVAHLVVDDTRTSAEIEALQVAARSMGATARRR